MIDLTQIKPLHDDDTVEIDGDECRVCIGTEVALVVFETGEVKCVCSTCLPTNDWEKPASCYERALRYAKMARFLSRDV